ncbi:hypothetical protein EV138_5237 [Kribbella voronezhensis]|uniref:Uncharacterized protein n=1 Tax=Kribbella voronezhensis TaxID=2512212 RepID=A0A4R7TIV7_9ACTN|nr:hypothetical protein [Kribbella voronezhensis]TDU91626.1 hypothetical protein EV138_5237 [Kribbella voronezhensis]
MVSDPDVPDSIVEVPAEAPEADVLEQYQPSAGLEEVIDTHPDLPDEADPADVDEQRRTVGEADDDDYR